MSFFDQEMAQLNSPQQPKDLGVRGLKIIEKLGEGEQGAAYKVFYKGYLACAKEYIAIDEMEREFDMLFEAQDSGSVPEIYAVLQRRGIIIMELVEGKTLEDFICDDEPSSQQLHRVMMNALSALLDLHETGVIHNDFHADNFMVDIENNHEIRIIDLGLASKEGKSPYPDSSLEHIQKFPHLDPSLANGGRCSQRTDLYSFGYCLSIISRLYSCPVYEYYTEVFCKGKSQIIEFNDFLASNCQDCGYRTNEKIYDQHIYNGISSHSEHDQDHLDNQDTLNHISQAYQSERQENGRSNIEEQGRLEDKIEHFSKSPKRHSRLNRMRNVWKYFGKIFCCGAPETN